MSDQPTLGLGLIVKDEQDTLPVLLASIAGAFDRIVLVDTGSTDTTVQLFEDWATGEELAGRLGSHLVLEFDWCDDFAAARQHAHARLATDWECWADADDEIVGADQLRALAAEQPAEITALIGVYDYAHDQHGNVVCQLHRERLVRAGAGEWQGRVHEAQIVEGQAVFIPPDRARWVHRKNLEAGDPERNLRILSAWVDDEPENARVLSYLGTEELTRGRPDVAIGWFDRYLELKTGWDEERAQVHRKLALCHMAEDNQDEAIRVGCESMVLLPSWPDSYLSLAEAHYHQGELGKAIHWADQALARGVPQTLVIINPLEYLVQPRAIKAGALAQLGQLDQAIGLAEEILGLVPDHQVAGNYPVWLAQRKQETTASAVVAMADNLIGHDEQLKALAVLEAAPHYAYDHPQVVAWRSMIRERLTPLHDSAGYSEHYEVGGSKPEDMVPDDQVLDLGDRLPRCGFLLAGLQEQAAA